VDGDPTRFQTFQNLFAGLLHHDEHSAGHGPQVLVRDDERAPQVAILNQTSRG
jgi:hypothetical protein